MTSISSKHRHLISNNTHMSLQLYPLGRQDFSGIIKEGKVYVDKTMHAYNIIQRSKSNFLSKPRRFGKSLFISMLESLFLGKKELFKDTYIYDKWEFEEYPIIRISFSDIGYQTMGLQLAISTSLSKIATKYGIIIHSRENDIGYKFRELIESLYNKHQKEVVILIDEYDKPLIDYLDKEKIHKGVENRDILKSFYSVLKDAEPFIKLLFITGVSKFSKVSIFSDLNNLTDLSIAPAFNEICGISQKELEAYFPKELELYDKEKIKKWYNGYKWDINGSTLYNPYSLLSFFFNEGRYQNYWFTSGTPTFLMKLCRENHLYDFEEITLHQNDLGHFDIEDLQIEPVLFQTGYLTITGENSLTRNYILSFPNIEVKESYLRNLLDAYTGSHRIKSSKLLEDLLKSLQANDKNLMQNAINSAFAHIPYDLWQKENEQYYHAIVHLLFSLLNVYIFSEVHTKNGRADAVVIHENQIFCFEFKLNKSAQEAFDQIKIREYTYKFKDSKQPIHHIGINFNSDNRAVEEIIWEEMT